MRPIDQYSKFLTSDLKCYTFACDWLPVQQKLIGLYTGLVIDLAVTFFCFIQSIAVRYAMPIADAYL